ETQHGNDERHGTPGLTRDGDSRFYIERSHRRARSTPPESGGFGSRETAYVHGRVQAAGSCRGGCGERVWRDWRCASAPWLVFFASDEVAQRTRGRNPGRVGSAEARTQVEGQSAERGESETAAR